MSSHIYKFYSAAPSCLLRFSPKMKYCENCKITIKGKRAYEAHIKEDDSKRRRRIILGEDNKVKNNYNLIQNLLI